MNSTPAPLSAPVTASTPLSPTPIQAKTKMKTKWTPAMEEVLLQTLIQAEIDGLGTDNTGFKPQGWTRTVVEVNKIGQKVDKNICKNKLATFKTIWQLWKEHLKAVSGWGWSDEKSIPWTDPEIMNNYFNKNSQRA